MKAFFNHKLCRSRARSRKCISVIRDREKNEKEKERKKGERERGLEPNSALHKNVLGALAANAKKICECRHTENHTISNV